MRPLDRQSEGLIDTLRAMALQSFAICVLAAISPLAFAAAVEAIVVDQDNLPLSDVAVFISPVNSQATSAPQGLKAVMDQINTRFVPHFLVVQMGTLVEFPNSDTVAHHVYSFSSPNQFRLPLYKGDIHPPVRFDEQGVVTLGCNIHDAMLGYILVVGTPDFVLTDSSGRAQLAPLDAEEYEIRIWSPRIRDDVNALAQTVTAADVRSGVVRFELRKSLRPAHDESSDSISWSEY